MNISDLYQIFLKHRKVSTDTRSDLTGCVFFALKGTSFDGNTFVEQAFAKGATCCVIDNPNYYIDEKTILVDEVLATLQQLATFHREQYNIPVLAITGSNGKTTTKELVNAVLSTTYKTTCTKGNLNNHIGVPLTLLSMPDETEFAIIEMGANHPKEIEFLCHIAKPNFGLITNIGKAHLEGFGGFEGVVNTKNELYQYIGKCVKDEEQRHCERSKAIHKTVRPQDRKTVRGFEVSVTGQARNDQFKVQSFAEKNDSPLSTLHSPLSTLDSQLSTLHSPLSTLHSKSLLFVNHDDELLMDLSKNIPKITYGMSSSSDCSGCNIDMNPFLSIDIHLNKKKHKTNSKLIGAYNAPNILAAACIGNHFHVPAEKIVSALENYQPDNMRSQIEKRGSNTVIVDTYNANPTSMSAALDNFFMLNFPRKIVILGDMLELGTWSMEEHQKIINKLINSNIDEAFLVGKHFKSLQTSSGFGYFDDVEELVRFFESKNIANSLILIKGSRDVRLEKILHTLKDGQ